MTPNLFVNSRAIGKCHGLYLDPRPLFENRLHNALIPNSQETYVSSASLIKHCLVFLSDTHTHTHTHTRGL
jgi:hypothetical protein